MLKTVENQVWAYDVEWVPDPASGRRVYNLPAAMSDQEVLQTMWQAGGATAEDPTPYLKTALCRIVSIAAVVRKVLSDGTVELRVMSLPPLPLDTTIDLHAPTQEGDMIRRFLEGVGRHKPQLVGFNSLQSDLLILLQRALVHRLSVPDFCRRPSKPWEGVDYFARGGDFHIDLRDMLSAFGKASATLHELATVAGIPGKMDTSGEMVWQLWQQGKIADIVAYNQCDALTTYLLWLRLAHLSGLLNTRQFNQEEQQCEQYLESLAPSAPHLQKYLEMWQRLR